MKLNTSFRVVLSLLALACFALVVRVVTNKGQNKADNTAKLQQKFIRIKEQIAEVSCRCGASHNTEAGFYLTRDQQTGLYGLELYYSGKGDVPPRTEYYIITKDAPVSPKADGYSGTIWYIQPKALNWHFDACWRSIEEQLSPEVKKAIFSQ